MRPSGLKRTPQRRPSAEKMLLAYEFIEGARAQPIGERAIRTLAGFLHGASRPITSTPGGGVNEN